MVSILVNLAYVRRKVARKFEFKDGYSIYFSAAMEKVLQLQLTEKDHDTSGEESEDAGYAAPKA